MDFYAVLDQVVDLLRRRGRVTYGALKRQFQLDDAYLNDLKNELIEGQRLAVDEAGRVLVWIGASGATASPVSPASLASVPASAPAASPPEAERRQLTVLFCDLVDSTVLASQLDPEDLREVVRAYQEVCAKVVARFEGHIAQYLGDGLLVYFGYPLAHEDDVQRAVHAGLGMIEALGQLNTRLAQERGVQLAVRMGIHTGLVVVGEVGGGTRQEQLALGEAPNIAARLQGLAAPNAIVISAATQQLIQGYFTCHALGSQTLKGIATPLPVYQVERATEVQQRFDVAAARGLTPLVGREHEVAFLRERWAQVQAGRGHIVLLSGEAGIGKSRLVQVVKDEIIEATTLRIEYRCSAYHQHSAFYPIIAHLERVLALRQEETPEAKLCKLEAALQPYPLPLVEVVPLLAALLAVPLSGSYPPLTLTPQRQKQQTLEVLLTWLLGLTEQQPVLFVVEDLHWIDPSTLEFLTLLVEQGPTARLLALLTCRPEFQPPWGLRTHLTPMALQRLPQPQVEVLIARVTGGKALPPEVVAHIVAKTDGVPLFVEELTKTVLESGLLRETAGHYALTGPVPPLAIPTTLHDSLMARLDRLAAVKTIAQLGATLGREFPYGLLQAVSPWDEETLRQGIQQLVEAEFLYQQGLPPQATYLFKHALIQDAAYQSLLKSTRQRYHQQIAQALEAQFSETVETQPELLAHHYTEAGLVAQAVSYWQRAGERANGRSAYVEASSHLTKGLEVLMNLPQAPERTQRELDIRLTLGLAFMALKGFGAPEVEQTYTQAYDLCQRLQIDSSPQLLQVLYGLRRVYTHRCNLPKAQEIAEHCLHLAQKLHDVYMQIDAYYSLGLSLMQRGDIIAGQAACEQGIALDIHPQQRMVASRRTAIDPGVSCRLFVSWLLWLRGYPDRALRTADEALTLAQALPNPLLHSHALIFVAWLHNYRRERSATQERAEAAIDLAREHTYAQQWAWGIMLRGWAITDRVEGITQIRESLEAALGIGTSAFRPYLLALLIEMHAALGQPAEGMRILAEALELVETTGARLHEAELYRLKGELLLQQTLPDAQQAEAGFQQALDIARRQQAKSWELRAAMSLARLWHQQGKCAEAHALLAPVYGWFTEGFDTADLQDAKALLGTLA